jgi:hypothetical protein
MSQSIEKSNGNIIDINDNVIDNTYSIQLIGKNRPNYGVSVNQNFFKLMENFSSVTPPVNPQNGQLWWNSNGQLQVYDNSKWKYIGSITASAEEPLSPTIGDQWFDTLNEQLKIYNGTTWILIGPSDSSFTTLNGFVTEKITVSSTDYYVASMYANGVRIAILSKDTFNANISNFGNVLITPGINYNKVLSGISTNNGNINSNVILNNSNISTSNLSVTNQLQVSGNTITNNLTANSCTFSNATISSTLTSYVVSSTNLIGNILTSAQPNITSLGNIVELTVTGNVFANSIITSSMSLEGWPVSIGAPDSAGPGYRLLRIANGLL